MPAPRMPLSKRTRSQRGSPSLNSTSSLSDDEDAITPCPIERVEEQHEQPKEEEHAVSAQRKGAGAGSDNSRRSSWRHSQGFSHLADHDQHGHDLDAELLWHRMLTVQQIYGCYNSARMTAALEMGNDGGIVRKFFHTPRVPRAETAERTVSLTQMRSLPVASRTCLDLLNDSLNQLPEDERREVEEFLEHDHPSSKRHSVWSHIGIRT